MFYLRSLIEFGQIHNWDYLYTSEFKKWFLNSLVYHPYNLNSFKDKGQIMKFLFNFVFFGVLFYLIWMFFPDTFTMLVNFAKCHKNSVLLPSGNESNFCLPLDYKGVRVFGDFAKTAANMQ